MTFDEKEPRLDIVCQQNDSSLTYISVQSLFNEFRNITRVDNNTVLVSLASVPPGIRDEEAEGKGPVNLYFTDKGTVVEVVWEFNATEVPNDYLPKVEEARSCDNSKFLKGA